MPTTYKIFRDPVHNVITFDLRRDRLLLDLINTRTFQRLRSIRQLGFSWVAYSGAEHSRFTHSLGACHLANRVLDHLGKAHTLDPDDCVAAQAAALLHDVGHGPFSHLYESAFTGARTHEAWGGDIITNPSSDIHRALRAHDAALPGRVAAVLDKSYHPAYVTQLVSSQLDVDRFDYLLRDSLMTGAQYGLFDIEWILNSLTLADVTVNGRKERTLAIDAGRGLHSVEQHLLGRHFMYRQVYFHPACRSADMIAKAIFKRLTVIEPPAETPRAMAAAAKGVTPTLTDYLELDDFQMMTLFRRWAREAADPVLADLSGRIIDRRLFSTLDWSGFDEPTLELLHQTLRSAVAEAGFNPDSYALMDRAADIPYRDVVSFARSGKAGDEIWLITEGQLRRLSELSDVLRAIANRAVAQVYGCYPPEAAAVVKPALDALKLPARATRTA